MADYLYLKQHMSDIDFNLKLIPDDLGPPYEKCIDCGKPSTTWLEGGQTCICEACHRKRTDALRDGIERLVALPKGSKLCPETIGTPVCQVLFGGKSE